MRFSALGLVTGLTLTVAQPTPLRAETILNGSHSITGGLCVGSACGQGEGGDLNDWFKLKAPRLSVIFEDSSTAASASTMDWWLQPNGTLDYEEFFRIWGDGVPIFQLTGGAPANSLFVSAGGNIGLGTSLPQADIHIADTSMTSIRMEQTTGGGLPPGEWDIRANNGGFWIMDLTGDAFSTAFQIQQGVPHLAMTLDDRGRLGLGLPSLGMGLELRRDDGLAAIGVTEASPNTSPRTLLNLVNNGRPEIVMANTATQSEWSIGAGSNLVLKRGLVGSRSAAKDLILKIDGTKGDLLIDGQIYTGGATCGSGCDAVFDPDYDLPSIADHAAQMFALGHLPNVGPTAPGQPLNLTERYGTLLNELEHAHIYIARMQETLGAQQALNAQLLARLDRLEAAATD